MNLLPVDQKRPLMTFADRLAGQILPDGATFTDASGRIVVH
jgi:hypothetical protein